MGLGLGLGLAELALVGLREEGRAVVVAREAVVHTDHAPDAEAVVEEAHLLGVGVEVHLVAWGGGQGEG